jgi:hypothetical protein
VYVESPDQSTAVKRAQQAIDFALADYGLDSKQADVTISCSDTCLTPQSLVSIGVGVKVVMPLVPAVLNLDQKILATFPEGYRHLAYIQTRIGYNVKMDMPMLKGEVVEELYKRGALWLSGGPLQR